MFERELFFLLFFAWRHFPTSSKCRFLPQLAKIANDVKIGDSLLPLLKCSFRRVFVNPVSWVSETFRMAAFLQTERDHSAICSVAHRV